MKSKGILITGSSSGLGAATARRLAAEGFYVYATAREPNGLFNGTENVREIKMDVAAPQSIQVALNEVRTFSDNHPLWGLVNNAGICVPAPLELLPVDDLRHQLEVNVVGQISVTQAFLPLLRESNGRIVNIASGLGSIAVPYLGAYSISQFAKMAFTDVLRRELHHSGVTVSVIQPGAVNTPIWEKLHGIGRNVLEHAIPAICDIYERSFSKFLEARVEDGRTSATTEDMFAELVLEVFTCTAPKTHYAIGADAKEFIAKSHDLDAKEIDRLFFDVVPGVVDFKN